ncbi:MAG: electron transport complex protein RnfA [Bacilli bacterium]
MTIYTFLAAIISAMLINNVVLMQFLGICPFLGVSKKIEASVGMSAAVAFVMLIATIVTWPLYTFILVPLEIEFLSTIAFILVIASLVQLVEMILKKHSPSLYKSLGVYLPLITTNCAILGVANSNVLIEVPGASQLAVFGLVIATTLGTALGFGLIMFSFSSIRERLDSLDIPEAFKGVPISLVVAGCMSLAFIGLGGLIG